jgi:hypothetical protein
MNREQFQRELKALAVQKAREIVANQDENRKVAQTAQQVFKALIDAPVWGIAVAPKPKDFNAPLSELWTQPVTFTNFDAKESDDNT